jgi:uncharacterized protein YaaR (DUF327 family)
MWINSSTFDFLQPGGTSMAIKIDRESALRKTINRQTTPIAESGASFGEMLSDRKDAFNAEALKALLDKVEDQARRVSVSRTVHDVVQYKRYVRTFIEEAVRAGLASKQSRSWGRGGARQLLVQTIDRKLTRLADDLINRDKDQLEILDRLDEIRGMLINLYI